MLIRRERVEETDELNLTPLIDCVFLLLIFFMVTTVFKQPHGLRVLLPEARSASLIEEKKLTVTIDSDGRMDVNGRGATPGQLEEVLVREREQSKAVILIIRTDKQTKHGLVLDTVEIAKRVGVEKIVLAAEKKKG